MSTSLSKPVKYMLFGGVFIAGYLVLQPMLFPDAPTTVAKKAPPKSSSKKGQVTYLESDYKAHFDPIKSNIKDSFKPIVYKVPNVRAASAQLNIIPPAFAGGEQNWTYTGSAEVDGVLEALLENKATGDNVFLKVGDTWKGISVEEITDDTLVLASPETGMEKKLELPTEDTAAPGFAPAQVNPQLRGNIGPLSVQPDGTAMQQPDMTGGGFYNGGDNSGGGNGGGRRGGSNGRRRGRSGGGGGGGNFGG
jgi:hypothetical protein